MRHWNYGLLAGMFIIASIMNVEAVSPSGKTSRCIMCHQEVTPGIVADWEKSAHAKISLKDAFKKPFLERLVSIGKLPDDAPDTSVGCAECHTLNPDSHKDTFDHNSYRVHPVVTPADCASCHPEERKQFNMNLMSHAHANLYDNPVFHSLVHAVNGPQTFVHGKPGAAGAHSIEQKESSGETDLESCTFCHGSEVKVEGKEVRDTGMGEMEFPILSGWPNQGVGRVNPDGSKGSCSACHARHSFSIAVARKPYTCAECHKGPDVPAYKVYMVSKHGNLFSSLQNEWDFKSVPWKVGEDFTAPTCAVCHVSQLVNKRNDLLALRTHQMNDRSKWRLFGLIYAHAHPKSPDTTIIKNSAGLPLPTELTGEPVSKYLIDEEEQEIRQMTMENVCLSCHSTSWVVKRFEQLDHTVKETNRHTLEATKLMLKAWESGAARGLARNDSIFNEAIERKWVENWLFYANSIRFSSAMGGADYGVFANGRWAQTRNLTELADWLEFKRAAQLQQPAGSESKSENTKGE